MIENEVNGLEIAVIGMSGRFPGAKNVNEFWGNLKQGSESITFFSDDELEEEQIELIGNNNYVKAKGILEEVDYFDASFFNYLPKAAQTMDPQLRFLHECAWEALEDSGYVPENYSGLIGSFIGATTNLLWLNKIMNDRSSLSQQYDSSIFSKSEFFSTRLSYNLNLKGPSFTVQTACSSSLVSVHLACQSLLSGECDMALAGGVSIMLPQKTGYIFQEGMIMSPDGHCRAFDEESKGTVGGNGIGIVVLKRLEDAMKDGDSIYAVIKGSAINNDGANKVGYTAPSVQGQADAIKSAQYMAEVEPESISYVETHGTGTFLGDQIEVEGLKLAFNSKEEGFCAIGSVKPNIGHLDNASGIAGFIKTIMALKHKLIPPSINYNKPNAKIDFENSPFFVNKNLTVWKNDKYPLRAGVSSFGIGGTNAHVVLEEAPILDNGKEDKEYTLFLISARSKRALENYSKNICNYLKENKQMNIEDISYTLQVGRKHFNYRRMFVCKNFDEGIRYLEHSNFIDSLQNVVKDNKKVVFLFPGQGTQYINMGKELYDNEPIFRNEIDDCIRLLQPMVDFNVKAVLYTDNVNKDMINETYIAQPILFIFEYSLAKFLMHLGVIPDAMIGHSLGEYVAACISGVIFLEDALKLITLRGKLMQSTSRGTMLSVEISEEELKPFLNSHISLAAVNGASRCVISGSNIDIDAIEKKLLEKKYNTIRLKTSHAFHSALMEPILQEYNRTLETINFNKPSIKYISNLTGDWIDKEEVVRCDYWVNHLRQTVRFNDGINRLLLDDSNIFIEVGAGKTLSTFVSQSRNKKENKVIINLIRHPQEKEFDYVNMLKCLGQLWVNGIDVDFNKFHFKKNKRRRISLPSYPFEKQYFGLDVIRPIDNNLDIKDVNLECIDNENQVLPTNEIEQKVSKAFEQVLGLKNIDIHQEFFQLGGDSLKAITVVGELQNEFEIKLNQIFEHPTIYKLSRNILYKKDNLKRKVEIMKMMNSAIENYNSDNITNDINYKKEYELYLKKNSAYENRDLSQRKVYERILLTGSTGYLGIYLLRDLLTYTTSDIYVIIRGKSVTEAKERLQSKLQYYFKDFDYKLLDERVVVINGNLTKESFSLPLEIYNNLAKDIDCIVHAAANVSHFGKYSDFYETNVKATKNLVEFANLLKEKDFQYISTVAIFQGTNTNSNKRLITEYDHDFGQINNSYYAKSKFEAEKVILDARKSGLNANIFRIGDIMFDSNSGVFQENKEQNAIYATIKAFIKIGSIPELNNFNTFLCVDYVSRAIVLLFDRVELVNEIHHIFNQFPVSLSKLLTHEDLGLGVVKLTINDFWQYVYENYTNPKMFPHISTLLTHLYPEDYKEIETMLQRPLLTSEKTTSILKHIGFEWCQIDVQHIHIMIKHCKNVGFLE